MNSRFLQGLRTSVCMAALVLPAALAASAVRAVVRRFVVHFPTSSRAPDRDSQSAMAEQPHLGALPEHRVPQLQDEQKTAPQLAPLVVVQPRL